MPRNACSRDRLNHGRAQIVVARQRAQRRRFARLKQQGLEPYHQRLGGVLPLGRPWRQPAEAELLSLLGRLDGREAVTHLFVHPDDVRRLPLSLRRALYLDYPKLTVLADRLRYRRDPRDPWDWPLPASMLAGARSRARAQWRREAWEEAEDALAEEASRASAAGPASRG